MKVPDTLVELAEAGYRALDTSLCACGVKMYWFLTPKNRRMPFSLKAELMVGEDTIYRQRAVTRYEPHFAACPHANRFRKKPIAKAEKRS